MNDKIPLDKIKEYLKSEGNKKDSNYLRLWTEEIGESNKEGFT